MTEPGEQTEEQRKGYLLGSALRVTQAISLALANEPLKPAFVAVVDTARLDAGTVSTFLHLNAEMAEKISPRDVARMMVHCYAALCTKAGLDVEQSVMTMVDALMESMQPPD